MMEIPTVNPVTPIDEADDDWLFGKPEQDAMIIAARQDHLSMLTHATVDKLVDLLRLRAKLQGRGEPLQFADHLPWVDAIGELERARLQYVTDLRRYDAPVVIRDAATRYAGATIAGTIEGFMERYREIMWDEVLAARAAAQNAG
jgi:hypothetical protein